MNSLGFGQNGVLEIIRSDPNSRGFVFKPGPKLMHEFNLSFTMGCIITLLTRLDMSLLPWLSLDQTVA